MCELGKVSTHLEAPFPHLRNGSGERGAGAHLRPKPRASLQGGRRASLLWAQFLAQSMPSTHINGLGLQTEDLRDHRGMAAPEDVRGLLGWAGLISQGPRRLLPFLPSSQVKRAAAGPLDQGQTGGRAGGGELSGTGRKEGIVCRNPTEGPGVTMRGILLGETDMAFFPPTAAKTAHWI